MTEHFQTTPNAHACACLVNARLIRRNLHSICSTLRATLLNVKITRLRNSTINTTHGNPSTKIILNCSQCNCFCLISSKQMQLKKHPGELATNAAQAAEPCMVKLSPTEHKIVTKSKERLLWTAITPTNCKLARNQSRRHLFNDTDKQKGKHNNTVQAKRISTVYATNQPHN